MEESSAEKVRWAHHYSSLHEILLVGEGDFSFALSLAAVFGSATNIVATSLDSRGVLLKKYSKAKHNLESLEKMGAVLLNGVDATKMKLCADLKMRKFDRIVYNFPHAGFKGKEDHKLLIKKLVSGFFQNARHMLRPYGEVVVSHKIGGPYCKWKLEELASKNSLVLVERSDFRIEDYPGYNNKTGDGPQCDQPFPLGKCCTFKFRIGDIHTKKNALGKKLFSVWRSSSNAAPEADHTVLESSNGGNQPLSLVYPGGDHSSRRSNSREAWRDFLISSESISGAVNCTPSISVPKGDISGAHSLIGNISPCYVPAIQGGLKTGYELYTEKAEGMIDCSYLRYLEELHHQSILIQEELRRMLSRVDERTDREIVILE